MIEVRALTKTLGSTRVLDGISFVAPSGQITGLLGPNGAGKTTAMRVLATLLHPDDGEVRIDGVDLATEPLEARRRIGLVTEEPGLFDRLSVREQLLFVAEVHGLSRSAATERIEQLAEALRMTDLLDARAGVLSKGNRQKVSLCRALVHDPPVLLLDEPTSGLDVVAAEGLQELLESADLTAERTVLLSTHRVDEAERLCERVVGLAAGRVVVDASLAELVAADGATDFRSTFVRLLGEATLAGRVAEQ
ncbi:MAG: ABC transporter ATP-binding protein [Acidimicrobiia bacterium]|nr:ABC transporter ATP-binding protein [Acidimicrobiia bacterium]